MTVYTPMHYQKRLYIPRAQNIFHCYKDVDNMNRPDGLWLLKSVIHRHRIPLRMYSENFSISFLLDLQVKIFRGKKRICLNVPFHTG